MQSCPERLSSMTHTIAVTALTLAGHFFSLDVSKTLVSSVRWAEALLEMHPCHTSVRFLPCCPAAAPTRQLLVQM